ncbi:hypothetical protein MGYG_00516 [Nannizzia gypsea CBS 118893]|uniref:Uncharacterized protein n=1 Tax=Arthroderma gypseum (strain ATCC MYA-4604 / CBS 118893) TaxID=535722 RepID=E5R065_ARTGP|nr:hypothetical protein MGYG_00516 [Nannizzia gypsea CBS 118893]EFQ97476.1 hypothetical protein MGYG_00516 [Nannizzia gypsea CBS 118893]
MPEEMENNNFIPTLQGPPPHYTGPQSSLAGYPGDNAKYASVIRDKMGSDPSVTHTHTHHHSYVENTFRPQQPITYDAASRLVLAVPATNNTYGNSQPAGPAEGFAASVVASPKGPSHHQQHNRPFYGGASTLGLHSQGPEQNQPTHEHSRHVSNELRETSHTVPSRPASHAALATLTSKSNVTTSQGTGGLGGGNTAEMEFYYHNHGIPGTRSNHRMVTAINPALAAHPLQNLAGIETGGHHGHGGEFAVHFNPHRHSPQRTHHGGQHSFSLDPGSSHYPPPAFAPSMPRSVPPINFAKHAKNATVSAPATSAPTPASKTRPASPAGPFIPGPDSISPTKQEEKFNVQKLLLERLGEKSAAEALDIDFSMLTFNQADHYLDLIGAPPRPKPEVLAARNAITGEGEAATSKVAPQSLAPGKSMKASLSPDDHQLLHRTSHNHSTQKHPDDLARGVALAAKYNIPGLAITRVAKFRQEREAAMAQEKESPQIAAVSRAPSPKHDTGENFASPAWDVSNLRKAGVIPSATPGPSETKNITTAHRSGARKNFPPPGLIRPHVNYYPGDYVGINRPVPWVVDTPEEAEKKAKKVEAATTSEAEKPLPVLPPARTLQQSPIGTERRSMLLAGERNARVSETLKWYRADYRWNEGLRERLDTIMKENQHYQENSQAPVAVPKELFDSAEQNTALLAQAIVNLQSYLEGDAREQSENFAQYGPVPDECCEPSKDGNFSLFDVQPGPFRGPETRN